MAAVSLKVNGHVHTVDADPQTPLLYVLSDDLQLRGPKFGCGLGQCGTCTVIIDGRAVRFSATSLMEPFATAQGPFDTHPSHIDPEKLDSWLAVAPDGTVTAYTGKCDFGQGMLTVQTQLVAEELRVPVNRVNVIQCDTSITPDQGTTSGSQSTPTNFNARNLAQAAATAREALLGMAAQKLGVPADQLTVKDGLVSAKNGRQISYGELIGGKHFDVPV